MIDNFYFEEIRIVDGDEIINMQYRDYYIRLRYSKYYDPIFHLIRNKNNIFEFVQTKPIKNINKSNSRFCSYFDIKDLIKFNSYKLKRINYAATRNRFFTDDPYTQSLYDNTSKIIEDFLPENLKFYDKKEYEYDISFFKILEKECDFKIKKMSYRKNKIKYIEFEYTPVFKNFKYVTRQRSFYSINSNAIDFFEKYLNFKKIKSVNSLKELNYKNYIYNIHEFTNFFELNKNEKAEILNELICNSDLLSDSLIANIIDYCIDNYNDICTFSLSTGMYSELFLEIINYFIDNYSNINQKTKKCIIQNIDSIPNFYKDKLKYKEFLNKIKGEM